MDKAPAVVELLWYKIVALLGSDTGSLVGLYWCKLVVVGKFGTDRCRKVERLYANLLSRVDDKTFLFFLRCPFALPWFFGKKSH